MLLKILLRAGHIKTPRDKSAFNIIMAAFTNTKMALGLLQTRGGSYGDNGRSTSNFHAPRGKGVHPLSQVWDVYSEKHCNNFLNRLALLS